MPSDVGERKLLELIGKIYEAAEKPELWSKFLKALAFTIGAGLATFVVQDLADRNATIGASYNFDPQYASAYAEHYSKLNVYMQKPELHFAGSVAVGAEICDEAFLRKHEYYNDFLRPMGLFDTCGAVIFREASRSALITTVKVGSSYSYGEREKEILRLLLPHLQTALRIHRRIASLDSEHSAMLEIADQIPTGIVLLNRKGRITARNRAAERIFAQGDGLLDDKEGVHAGASWEERQLRGAIASCLETSAGGGFGAGEILNISRPSGRRPYQLFVCPLHGNRNVLGEPYASAAIFITDPEDAPELDPGAMRLAYGLTPAETRLASLLSHGRSLEEASAELGVSINTVRTHLRHVFEKTETNRQAELVRLLSRTVPPAAS